MVFASIKYFNIVSCHGSMAAHSFKQSGIGSISNALLQITSAREHSILKVFRKLEEVWEKWTEKLPLTATHFTVPMYSEGNGLL